MRGGAAAWVGHSGAERAARDAPVVRSDGVSSVGDAAALGAAVEGRPAPQPARARLDKDFTCRSARVGWRTRRLTGFSGY